MEYNKKEFSDPNEYDRLPIDPPYEAPPPLIPMAQVNIGRSVQGGHRLYDIFFGNRTISDQQRSAIIK
jgi:hypothetical protein